LKNEVEVVTSVFAMYCAWISYNIYIDAQFTAPPNGLKAYNTTQYNTIQIYS